MFSCKYIHNLFHMFLILEENVNSILFRRKSMFENDNNKFSGIIR